MCVAAVLCGYNGRSPGSCVLSGGHVEIERIPVDINVLVTKKAITSFLQNMVFILKVFDPRFDLRIAGGSYSYSHVNGCLRRAFVSRLPPPSWASVSCCMWCPPAHRTIPPCQPRVMPTTRVSRRHRVRLLGVLAVQVLRPACRHPVNTAFSILFWTNSHAFISSIPPHPRRAMCLVPMLIGC